MTATAARPQAEAHDVASSPASENYQAHASETDSHGNSPAPPSAGDEETAIGGSSRDLGDEKSPVVHKFNEQTNYLPRRRLVAIFLTLSAVDFVALMDQTTLSVSLSIIGSKLNAGTQSSFVSSAYFITSTCCQLLYGRVSDITGRKVLLIIGLTIFFFSSLASALAPNIVCLAVFRAFSGIGGGGLMTLAQIIVSDIVSLRERGKYQGILGAVVAIANGIGPIIGGALASKATWRAIFYLNLPLSFICGLLVWFNMPLKKVEGHWKAKIMAIDWAGALLSLAASVLIVLGFTWAGGSYSWDSAHVLAPLIIGAATAVGFCLWQWKACTPSRPPLMPMSIFKSSIVCGACITQFINGWLFVTQVYYIPQFYELAYGHSPIVSGALLLPLTVVQTLSSTLSGLLITWTGRYREVLLSGWALWSIGLGLFSTLDTDSNLGKQIGYALLAGFGVGQTLQPSLIALQGAVPRKEMAAVTATRMFVRNLGGALGLALAGTIINNTTSSHLKPLGWDSEKIKQALDDPSSVLDSKDANHSATLSDTEFSALRSGYKAGFRNVFILLASLGAFSFIMALFFMKQKNINRDDDEKLKEQAKKEVEKEEEERRAKKQSRNKTTGSQPTPTNDLNISGLQTEDKKSLPNAYDHKKDNGQANATPSGSEPSEVHDAEETPKDFSEGDLEKIAGFEKGNRS